jgi:hypothetical protein
LATRQQDTQQATDQKAQKASAAGAQAAQPGFSKRAGRDPVYLTDTVLRPLNDLMKIRLQVNPEGVMILLHEKELPELPRWAEFDMETGRLTLNLFHGKIQDSGITLPAHKDPGAFADIRYLMTGQYDTESGKYVDGGVYPLIIRNQLH